MSPSPSANAPNPSTDRAPGAPARPRVELLAPAGDDAMMRAAVENGADAVYFGLEVLNARLRAANFAADDLPRIMSWLHERGVKGYVTLNTLVFSGELEDAAAALRACSAAGVDAVLIQDLGLARLAAEMVPDLPIHASTQMTLTCADSIMAARELGLPIERVVAAREMSRAELRRTLRDVTDCEMEVFIHGAMCVAYSGQCLTSEALGGRSANRGECAQACRLPYDLIVDGEKKELDDLRYLLSPKDLMGFGGVADLAAMGIVSIKIEGRLKSPEYVAATTQVYRKAIDQALAAELAHDAKHPEPPPLDDADRRKLEMTFSRGFTGGYLREINHQEVVEGRFPKKRGAYLGRVERRFEVNGAPAIAMTLEGPLKPGDGVVFDAGRPDQPEQGGRVYGLRDRGRPLERYEPEAESAAPARNAPRIDGRNDARFARGDRNASYPPPPPPAMTVIFGRESKLDISLVNVGDRVWKTSDPELDAELRRSFEGQKLHKRRPIWARVSGAAGEPLRLEMRDAEGRMAEAIDTEPAQAALKKPLTEATLLDQLGRLGDTPFELAGVEMALVGDLMVPFSRLNDLRRRAADALIEASRAPAPRRLDGGALARLRARAMPPRVKSGEDDSASDARDSASTFPPTNATALSVMCRTLDQVHAALDTGGVEAIITDFENPRLHAEARRIIPRGAGMPRHIAATLRVQKPGEEPLTRKLAEVEADGFLVRNLGAWRALRREWAERGPDVPRPAVIGDYSLNVANDVTARLLIEAGFDLLTPSYDLNIDQALDLLRAAPPEWFEITIHQHIPMFHMEHCVFCRFLSKGTDHTNCGRPCETHQVSLRDRMGFEHAIKADAGCRNTVFNAVAQSASEYLESMTDAGARRFRVELLGETPEQTKSVIRAYAAALSGDSDGRRLWRKLNAASKLGVTRGSLDHGL